MTHQRDTQNINFPPGESAQAGGVGDVWGNPASEDVSDVIAGRGFYTQTWGLLILWFHCKAGGFAQEMVGNCIEGRRRAVQNMLRNHLEKCQRHGLENVLALVLCSQRGNAAEPLLGQMESWLLCPTNIALCFAPSPVKDCSTFSSQRHALLGRNRADCCMEQSRCAQFCNPRVTNETSAGHFSMDVFISTSGLRCHNEKQHTGSPAPLSEISRPSGSEPAGFRANKESVGAAAASLLTQQPDVMRRADFSNLHLLEPRISHTFPPQKHRVRNTAESDYLDIFI